MLILRLRFFIVMLDTWRVKRCIIIIIIIIMAAYRWVYDSRHLQADCREPGSAPEPYARQSSTGYLQFLRRFISKMHDRDSQSDLAYYGRPAESVGQHGVLCTPSYALSQKCSFDKIALDLFMSLITIKPTVSQSTEMGECLAAQRQTDVIASSCAG